MGMPVNQISSIIHHVKSANVILMVQLLWNVIAVVIVLAEKDLQAQNVMNVYQMSSVTSVTHVNQASLIIHHVKKTANVILMVQQLWNVEKSTVIVLAEKDLKG